MDTQITALLQTSLAFGLAATGVGCLRIAFDENPKLLGKFAAVSAAGAFTMSGFIANTAHSTIIDAQKELASNRQTEALSCPAVDCNQSAIAIDRQP